MLNAIAEARPKFELSEGEVESQKIIKTHFVLAMSADRNQHFQQFFEKTIYELVCALFFFVSGNEEHIHKKIPYEGSNVYQYV